MKESFTGTLMPHANFFDIVLAFVNERGEKLLEGTPTRVIADFLVFACEKGFQLQPANPLAGHDPPLSPGRSPGDGPGPVRYPGRGPALDDRRGWEPSSPPGLASRLDRLLSSAGDAGPASKVRGIFFTPPPVGRFMARVALLTFLRGFIDDVHFLGYLLDDDSHDDDIPERWPDLARNVLEILQGANILDPACGSGNLLVATYREIAKVLDRACNVLKVEADSLKTRIILENLHGHEISPVLAFVTRLRLWLLLLGDEIDRAFASPAPGRRAFRSGDEIATIMDGALASMVPGDHPARVPGSFSLGIVQGDFLLQENEGSAYDLIIGNPPYVRQEEIIPPPPWQGASTPVAPGSIVNGAGHFSGDDTIPDEAAIRGKYIDAILSSLKKISKEEIKVNKQGDYYVYFLLKGIFMLQEGGVLVYITPNSWLQNRYGATVRDLVTTSRELHHVIEFSSRAFDMPEVNAIIVSIRNRRPSPGHRTAFLALENVPGEESSIISMMEQGFAEPDAETTTDAGDDVKRLVVPSWGIKTTVRQALLGDKNSIYGRGKWKAIFLCRDAFIHRFLSSGKLVPLGSIATVRAGCYTGINAFFYPEDDAIQEFDIEATYLRPIIRRPADIKALILRGTLPRSVLVVPPVSKERLRTLGAGGLLSYIEWGESRVTKPGQKTPGGIPWPRVASVRSRRFWYSLPEASVEPARLFIQYIAHDRFYAPFSPEPVASDRCFHRVFPTDGLEHAFLAALLNSTLEAYLALSLGHSNLGAGALKFETRDARMLPVPNPDLFSNKERARLVDLFEKLGRRPPLPLRDEIARPDKQELDALVLGKLGLDSREIKALQMATIELVDRRLAKARSRGAVRGCL